MSMKTVVIAFLFLSVAGLIYPQSTELFIPAGYNNPFLKSGQFIASLYYENQRSVYKLEEQETKNSEYNLSFVSYLGISDELTIRAGLDIFPSQPSYEIISGGYGGDKNKFHISPEFLISYRPLNSVEIFGRVFYQNYVTKHNQRAYYQDIPVDIDENGNVIYDKRLVVQPAYGDSDINSIGYKIGITFNSKLW